MANRNQLSPWQAFRPLGQSVGQPFDQMHRQIDRLFDNFWPAETAFPAAIDFPKLDVHGDDKQIVVTAELPGIDEKDVEVSLNDNVLTIRGEKKTEREEKDEKKNWYLSERSYGSFQRSIPLAVEIDQAKVAAKFTKGVLTVTLPKAAPQAAASTKIKIQS